MYNDLEIGSIVLLMNSEYNIYKAMIIQKDIKENNKEYKYLALPYPYCFVGVDSFTLINEDNIYDLVYNSKNKDEQNSKELVPSSVIEFNNKEYLIIGKNVKYLGQEKENEYALIEVDSKEDYVIEYVKEANIDKIINYGFINEEYKELDEDRYNRLNLSIRRFRAFLPIGSCVELKSVDGEEIEVMIIGRNVEVEKKETVDYIGMRYEATYLGNDYVYKFDKEQLNKIIHIGYFNNEEMKFNKEILIARGIMDRS